MISVIEIGEKNIKAVFGYGENNKINICARYNIPSVGIINGEIVEEEKLVKTLANLKNKIINDGYETDDFLLILPSNNLGIYRKRASNNTLSYNNVISNRDIELLKRACGKHQLHSDEITVEIYPISYMLDNEVEVKDDPIGETSSSIAIDAFITTLPSNKSKKYINILSEAGFKIKDYILAPIAASYSILNKDELQNGVLLVDIGSATTSIFLFYKGFLTSVKEVNLGMNDIDAEIAKKFNIDKVLAENLKINYGSAIASIVSDIVIYEDKNIVIKENELVSVVEEKLNDILNEIDKAIKSLIKDYSFKVILNGGGANMPNIRKKFYSYLNYECNTRTLNILGVRNTIYNNLIGGLYYILNKEV